MSDNKKYYYLKLKENFFDSDEVLILESMQDGYLYENILLKLYARSLKTDGKLMFNDVIPYNSQMLATITRHQVGTVEKALKVFAQLGLIEILDNGAIYMLNIQNFIGESSTEADRIRKYRKNINQEKALLEDNSVTNVRTNVQSQPYKCTPELELELEKELELNIPPLTPPQGGSAARAPQKTKVSRTTDFPASFLQFWSSYPKKRSKAQALKAWNNIPDPEALLPKMLETIRGFEQSCEWKRDDGRFIPYPATWLNANGWEDDIPSPLAEKQTTMATGGSAPRLTFNEMEERRLKVDAARFVYKHDGEPGLLQYCHDEKLNIDEVRTWIQTG